MPKIPRRRKWHAISRRSLALIPLFCVSIATEAQVSQTGGQGATQSRFQTMKYSAGDHLTFNDGWGIGLSAEHSDNIFRAEANQESSMIYSAFLNFNFALSQNKWSIAGTSNLSYQTYTAESVPNQLVGGFRGSAQADLLADYLVVYGDDQYGQTRTDQNVPDSPTNRSDLNVLTGGLKLHIPLGSHTSFIGDAAYSRTSYEVSTLSYRTTSFMAGFAQQLNPHVSMQLSANQQRVDYDTNPEVNNYYIEKAALGIDANLARTVIDFSGGLTRIRRHDDVGDNKPLLNFLIARKLGPRTEINFNIGTQYSDYAQTATQEQRAIGVQQQLSSANVLPVAQPFKSDYAFLGYVWNGSRYDLNLHAGWRRERYETTPDLDGTYRSAYAQLGRKVSANWQLTMRGDYSQNEREQNTRATREYSFRLSMDIRVLRKMLLQPYAATYHGSTEFSNYRENRFGIAISYSPNTTLAR